ncbi:protein of unknown function DUF427 [Thermosynechococcus sp. NK55a]|uniref:DUF427 domain-containing protein n=1 Tax=unclassified Thermosynechococcus TaxID=2622553 RepID=UPI0003D8BA73|nr:MULTISPECIES: DUF427 domain-containing protein [unclassified Thermosynechococcus]AHB87540.1 protein of unknown function DUF427 [Thermosynechococcus sp. NK55a]RMH66229.1 MAG: DUF427 domain-containing protein [Cyanobacteria bacterium J003]
MQQMPPAPGQESVWDYPRPPRLEPTAKHLRVVFNGVVIADTQRGQRVLETSHPPVYYFPPEDVQSQYLVPSARQTFCEWKGQGAYYHVKVGDRQAENAAWYYPKPTPAFAPIRNYIAFYAALMDECTVDGVVVIPQPGGFYGGWITPDIVGPFKGAPGTWGW